MESKLNIEAGRYYKTRNGRIAYVAYVSNVKQIAYAIHSPGALEESGMIWHEYPSGYALSFTIFPAMNPPSPFGHPSDLVEEIVKN